MRLAFAAVLVATGVAAAEPRFAPHYTIELALDPNAHALSANVELQLPPRESNWPEAFLLGATYAVSDASTDAGATISVQPPAGPGAPQTILVVRDSVAVADRKSGVGCSRPGYWSWPAPKASTRRTRGPRADTSRTN